MTLMEAAHQKIQDHGWIVPLVAPAFLIFKPVRIIVTKTFLLSVRAFIMPSRILAAINRALTKLDEMDARQMVCSAALNELTVLVTTMKNILGYNGGGGMMDMVGVLHGYQTNSFWQTSQPGFICTDKGDNVECTQGYLFLLGLKTREDLENLNWHSYVDPCDLKSYFDNFLFAAGRLGKFRYLLKFLDSNSEKIGEWVVVAAPLSSPGAKAVRYIGFLYPSCAIARERAAAMGWPLHPPT